MRDKRRDARSNERAANGGGFARLYCKGPLKRAHAQGFDRECLFSSVKTHKER